MPVIRYFLVVGSILLAGIWWFGHDTTGAVPPVRSVPEVWTALDRLRAIAHHGDRDTRSTAIFPPFAAVRLRPREASAKPTAKPDAPSASAPTMDARAEAVSRNKKTQKTLFAKQAAQRRKYFTQRSRPVTTRIAAENHVAPAVFGFPVLQ
ncbi:MAG: hypothetical protein ABI150_06695 [Nitrobacter sp.]